MSFTKQKRFDKRFRRLSSLPLSAVTLFAVVFSFFFAPPLSVVRASSTPQTLPFSQDWSNINLITANDDWSGVPGVEGFLGQDLTTATGTDPQTIVAGASSVANDLTVLANQTSTNISNGDVAEFHTTSQPAPNNSNPTIALQGSNTADAPHIILYLNTTGRTNITVAYNLRDIDCTADNAVQPVALQYRVGGSGNFTNVPAGYVADATTGPSLCTLVTPVSAALPAAADNQSLVQVRIITTNAVGNDEWVGVDDISVTGTSGGQPALSISCTPASFSESAGANASTCTVTRTGSTASAATVNLSSSDTSEATVPASVEIGASQTSATFTVSAVDDTVVDGTQTVTITASATGFTNGTTNVSVTDDDVAVVPIHQIQGSGAASPLAGSVVTTTGVVTLLRTGANGGNGSANGFFLQTPDNEADADPNTSQGIFVFTNGVPTYSGTTTTVTVGDELRVSGTATEFNGLTQIGSVTNLTVIDTGNPLPTAVTLDATILSPTAAPSQPQLEKFEAMRLRADSLKTVAPNDNFFDVETVLSNVPRPFREPGIPISNPVPPDPTTGTPDCCIPRWDENPERLKVDTNGRAGAANQPFTSNVVLTNPTGPLDFAFGEYRLVLESDPAASSNMTAAPIPAPATNEFTVVGYNIEFFQNETVQSQKAALTIRNILRYPDIIGVIEVDDLEDLQGLATRINNDAAAAGEPNPQYAAYLQEGNGGNGEIDQNVGFLVKTARVTVTTVTQERKNDTFVNPNNGQPETLHDRPPLVLRGAVNSQSGIQSPVIVIVNHLRSFIDSEIVGAEGVRVRAKRKAQAESLAGLLQELQTGNQTTPIISVGDYNAFEFNNGYDDPISVIKGMPRPDDEIVVDQSPDLVNPDFYNLIDDVPAPERYSFIFEGTPQALDHVLVNSVARARNTRATIAHVNADFPENPPAAYERNASRPERSSDHDPTVAYFSLLSPTAAEADISGQITAENKRPLRGVTVSLFNVNTGETVTRKTNAKGFYKFAAMAGGNYIVTPSSKVYRFEPFNRLVVLTGEQTDVDFIGFR